MDSRYRRGRCDDLDRIRSEHRSPCLLTTLSSCLEEKCIIFNRLDYILNNAISGLDNGVHYTQDLPRFEQGRANTLFRKFIDMPGKIIFDGESFMIKIRKRATTPILKGVKPLKDTLTIPWLDNRKMKIEWTA